MRPDPEALFARIDTNGDGVINKEEFMLFHQQMRPPRPPMNAPFDNSMPPPQCPLAPAPAQGGGFAPVPGPGPVQPPAPNPGPAPNPAG
jgi:hypothetical protein